MLGHYMKNIIYQQIRLKFYHLIIFFLECGIVQGMIVKGRKSNIIHIWTMTVDPGYKYVEKYSGGISSYMMQSKDNISSICFKLKN